MVVSPSLSHSSQLKAHYQWAIEFNEQVSDECSSGVMRAWHVAQSIPGVYSMCAGIVCCSEGAQSAFPECSLSLRRR